MEGEVLKLNHPFSFPARKSEELKGLVALARGLDLIDWLGGFVIRIYEKLGIDSMRWNYHDYVIKI